MNNRRYRIDLSTQMANCDANFIRLLKLMPALESFRIRCLQGPGYGLAANRSDDAVLRFPNKETSRSEYAREFLIASPVDNGHEAHVCISVVEVFPYTSTLAVTQMNRVSDWIDPPGILVRMYHDASTAEAVAYQGHRAFLARYALPNPTMYHQDEKRQINEFLGEWLSLCLQAGRSLSAPEFICAA